MAVAKIDSVRSLNFIGSLLSLEGVVTSDIESSYTFGVRCFNKRFRLDLASSIFKKWALKVWSEIDRNTLKSSRRLNIPPRKGFFLFLLSAPTVLKINKRTKKFNGHAQTI